MGQGKGIRRRSGIEKQLFYGDKDLNWIKEKYKDRLGNKFNLRYYDVRIFIPIPEKLIFLEYFDTNLENT